MYLHREDTLNIHEIFTAGCYTTVSNQHHIRINSTGNSKFKSKIYCFMITLNLNSLEICLSPVSQRKCKYIERHLGAMLNQCLIFIKAYLLKLELFSSKIKLALTWMVVLEHWILMYVEFTCLNSSLVYLPLSQDHGNKYLYVNWEKVNSISNVYIVWNISELHYLSALTS